jgi:hypothetical protein
MRVLTATNSSGQSLTTDQIKADWPKLKEAHDKACQDDPTWSMFGGLLYVNGNRYQVC